MQPDLLVARREEVTERDLPAAPVLAVEVLSPSTRRIDLTLKRSRFEAAGCASYWVFDPDDPALTVWELVDGTYARVGHVVGEQMHQAQRPFTVDICPANLVMD
ncbi:MAG: Uma2 family endonuclease [Nocardioidaceae bacterium]